MIFTSLILVAVSDRGLYANLPLYITTAPVDVERTNISTVQVKRFRSRKVDSRESQNCRQSRQLKQYSIKKI